jgi:hypothetical protein
VISASGSPAGPRPKRVSYHAGYPRRGTGADPYRGD